MEIKCAILWNDVNSGNNYLTLIDNEKKSVRTVLIITHSNQPYFYF